MTALTIRQRAEILAKANRTVSSVALQIDHPDMTATMARRALEHAADARRSAAVTGDDPPGMQQAMATLRVFEGSLRDLIRVKGWQ